jgi:hypothetical protein
MPFSAKPPCGRFSVWQWPELRPLRRLLEPPNGTDNPEAFKGQLISHISESEGSKRNREGYRSDTALIRPAGQCQHRGQSAAEETTAWLGW